MEDAGWLEKMHSSAVKGTLDEQMAPSKDHSLLSASCVLRRGDARLDPATLDPRQVSGRQEPEVLNMAVILGEFQPQLPMFWVSVSCQTGKRFSACHKTELNDNGARIYFNTGTFTGICTQT